MFGAYEFGNARVLRVKKYLLWYPDLFQFPAIHDGDSVADLLGLPLVMRDVNRRDSQSALEAPYLGAEVL
jgi:hypothetical protein